MGGSEWGLDREPRPWTCDEWAASGQSTFTHPLCVDTETRMADFWTRPYEHEVQTRLKDERFSPYPTVKFCCRRDAKTVRGSAVHRWL
ncbi:hypothetical protein BaRGS_00019145 [Batillaria attramentaria]|uniref:Uncharacterized protein n=1 Tax=Batillaria attramentaria TaxID=370345 RepID=A0ABD0KR52_9CAEN